MNVSRGTAATVAAFGVLTSVFLAGCGSSDTETPAAPATPSAVSSSPSGSSPTAQPTSSTEPSASASESVNGGEGTLVGPVVLTVETPDGVVAVGRDVVFDLPGKPESWTITGIGDPAPDVLTITPGGTEGSATFNWGGKAVKEGVGVYNAFNKKKGLYYPFVVTVVPEGSTVEQGAFPANQ